MALLLGTASFLVLFDSLAVATALPSIGAEFELRPGALQWVITLYSVSIGAMLILGGRVGDLYGRRRVLVASLALCTVAGLVAGFAFNVVVLLVGRVLQGIAAAFAIPAALSTAATVFPQEPWRSRVFSVIAFAAWSAGLAGAMLGGLLTLTFGWRSVFLVTVPVGVVAVIVARLLFPRDQHRPGGAGRLDVWGAVLASAGLCVLMIGLGQFADGTVTWQAAAILGAGLVLLTGFVLVERRVEHPLVPARVLRSRRTAGGCLAFGAYCAGYSAVVVLGSLHLQETHGLSAAEAGLVLTPVLVSGIFSSAVAGRIVRRFGARPVVTAALVVCALALCLIVTRSEVTSLLPWLLLWGLGSGPIYVGLIRECISEAAEQDRGTASALFESMSHVGGALAVAGYMTMLGAGMAYPVTGLSGAAVVAAGAVLALVILPRRTPEQS